MKTIPLIAATLPIFFALPLQAIPLAGAKTREWPAAPEHHKVTIQREAADENEQKLIAAAEKSQPEPTALLEAIRKDDGDAKPQAGQWWNKETLGIRIPFAITADAVHYYSELVTKFGEQKLVRFTQPSSTFTYHAKVSKPVAYEIDGKSLPNVTVVTMSMTFQQKFTATVSEGFRFDKKREVVFYKDGKILHVLGDGDTLVPVFAM
jgi:hypothetical protein